MKPWLDTFRKRLVARGRQGMKVIVTVAVYRGTVWVSVAPSFNGEAILDPDQIDNLVSTLTQAAQEARKYQP